MLSKLIFLLSIMLAGESPAISISIENKNRIMAAYKDQTSNMSNEYEAYGNRRLPLHSYRQVPEMRPHLPNEKFDVKVIKKSITLSLDGKEEITIDFYIKYTVYSDVDKPKFKFYMIITWPREGENSDFSLLRIYKHKTETLQVFLTRSAMDEIIVKEIYNTEKKLKGMEKMFKHIKEKEEWIREECNKAKLTTGTNFLMDYSLFSYAMWQFPFTHHDIIVLNNEEAIVVSGILYCNVKLGDDYLRLSYILTDIVRGWILVKEANSERRNITVGDQMFRATEWLIDDSNENP